MVDSTKSSGKKIITPFVLSDQGVGKFQQSASMLFYILLVAIFITFAVGDVSNISYIGPSHVGIGIGFIVGYILLFHFGYLLLYGDIKIDLSSIHLPSINMSSLPPVK